MLQLTVEERIKRVVIVSPAGRLDAFSAPTLREKLEALIEDHVRYLVIDLTAVDFLDSAAMAVLVSALRRMRQEGGDVKLVWPAEEAGRRILRLTKFDRVFDMLDSAESAL